MVYVFLAEGFEEIEALMPVDLLRRAGVAVKTVSVTDAREVTGARGIPVVADRMLNEIDFAKADMLVLPGGMPGTLNLAACDLLMSYVDEFVQSNSEEKRVAAICAAPAKILGLRGLAEGKKATCYPGLESELKGAEVVYDKVVTDGNITTSRGLGTAIDFACELIRIFVSQEKADEIRKSVVG